MFYLGLIWKSRLGRSISAALLALLIALVPMIALASNETYTWQDANRSAITASDGGYSGTTTFTKQGSNYVATNPSYLCGEGGSASGSGTSALRPSGSQFVLDNSAVTAPANCTLASFDGTVDVVAATNTTDDSAAADSCDQGSFTWFACPVMSNLASTISKIATVALRPLLEIHPLHNGSGLYQAWSHVRDLADVLFIIIFLLIIFSTTIQQGFDQYTVRKMMPRLIAAVILVQLSYFLVGMLIDLGNVLGNGIDDLLVSVMDPSNGGHSVSNFFGDIGAVALALAGVGGVFATFSTGFWVAAVPILATLALSVLIVLGALAARFIVIALLIIISPLAIAAWVLPNTEKHFKSWWSALTRLIMMYPIIMAILSVAGHINQLLPFSADDLSGTLGAILIALVKPLIIITALLLILKTWDWALKALGHLESIGKTMAGKSKDGLKGSNWWKDGEAQRNMNRTSHMLNRQNRAMLLRDPNKAQQIMSQSSWLRRNTGDRFTQSKLGRKTHGMRMGMRGLALGGVPATGLGMQRAYNAQFNDRVKELTDLENSEATFPNLQTAVKAMYGSNVAERKDNLNKLKEQAPSLVGYTRTTQGRAAIVRKLSDMGGIDDDLTRRMVDDPNARLEYNQFIGRKAAKPDPKGKPTITFARDYDPNQPQNTKFDVGMAASQIAKLNAHGLNETFDAANWTAGLGKGAGKDPSNKVAIFARDELSNSIAQTILDNTSYGALGQILTAGNREFADKDKRVNIVRMIRATDDLQTSGNAKLVRDTVINKLMERETYDATGNLANAQNTDIYDSLIETAIRGDGYKVGLGGADDDTAVAIARSWGYDQKRSFLRGWIH